ncbi:MAG TPA: hypothetical protein VGP24_08955 [Glaciihabitans sp.]|jgi:hypothetical protein|nr:hypothetical protein [Glaciihabitans sp.]
MTQEPTETRSDPKPKWLLPTITGVAGFVAGALTIGGVVLGVASVNASQQAAAAAKVHSQQSAAEAKKKGTLKGALVRCGLEDSSDSQLADSGYTLTINGWGNDDFSGLAIEDEACIMKYLKAPSAVVSHVDQTTSLDGRQTETWGSITMSWSYHPDRGLDAVLTVAK